MESTVTKAVVKSLEDSKSVEDSLQVNCESISDFANMTVEQILAAGGIRKYVFFLKNCKDKKDILTTALVNKETHVCVYTAQVNELVDNGKNISVIDDGKVIATYSALTYVVPCDSEFKPSETDYKNVLETLKSQIARRIANGTYEVS